MAKGGTVTFDFEGNDKDLDKKTKSIDEKLKSLGKSVGSSFLKGASVAGAAMTGLVGVSIKSYADMEQNIGGVQTLFKTSADTVIANAKKAYETAGLSANQYMETVTSFSASLLQSLGGDTVKAAQVADMAIIDMSDNANKMGTSMEAIQNAYQGFAKQNYTMLDNLKLGYGGTKEEMQRLLADAQKITGIKYDISNLNDVYQAIHVIQGELGITGTTAKEATETISGSVNAVKGAWSNFMSGSGSIDEVISTVSIAVTNVGSAIATMAPKIVDGLVGLVNGLLPEIPKLIQNLLPTIINGIIGLATGIINMLPQVISMLSSMLPQIAQTLVNGLMQVANSLSTMLPTLIPQIVRGIISLLEVFNQNFDKFLLMGAKLILGLIKGLINSIPDILMNLPTIITAILNFFTMSKLLSAGKTLIKGLAKGLTEGIPHLLKYIPKIVGTVVNGIKDGSINSLRDVGKMMIQGLWNGIGNAKQWLLDKITGLGKSILKTIKGIFGIHSPSREFAWIGKMNILGLEKGMEDMKGDLNTTFDDMMNLSPILLASASNSYNPNVNVIVNNSFEQDPLGQIVQKQKNLSGGSKNDYNFGLGG